MQADGGAQPRGIIAPLLPKRENARNPDIFSVRGHALKAGGIPTGAPGLARGRQPAFQKLAQLLQEMAEVVVLSELRG